MVYCSLVHLLHFSLSNGEEIGPVRIKTDSLYAREGEKFNDFQFPGNSCLDTETFPLRFTKNVA